MDIAGNRSANPRVYVLLPVHNRRVITEQYVHGLAAQTYRDVKLILIDDGSTDGTSEMVLTVLPDTAVLRGRGDWWWGGGLQQGLDWLARESVDDDALVLLTNDDLTIGPEFIERAVEVMRHRSRTLLLARVRNPADATITDPARHADLTRLTFEAATSDETVNCLPTHGLFARWRDLKEIGRFHPRLLPHYLSDYEYTIRAHRLGFQLETSAEVLVELMEGTTGFHVIAERHFGRFVRKLFSIKAPANPIYWSSFIVLACPARYWVRHLSVLWFNSLRLVAIEFVRSLKHARADRTLRL